MKAHTVYLTEYHSETEKMDSYVTGFLAVASNGSIAGWVIWKEWAFAWAAIVASSQLLNALKPYLPYRRRLAPLRKISYSFEELFLKAESRWHEMEKGKLTEDEINDIWTNFKSEKAKSWKTVIGDISIPHKDKLYELADQQAEDYFKRNF